MIKRKYFFLIILFCFVLNNMADSTELNFELYALKYGQSKYSTQYIYYNDNQNKFVDFHWLFFLIKLNEKIILVDTGFSNKALAEQFKITYTDPLDLLKDMGITPDMITDVIITHAHFDHIGNVDKFIKAKIYIQKDELDNYLKRTVDKNKIDFFNNNVLIKTFDKELIIYDLIKIINIGGHSTGSSAVAFNFNNKKYIITGDECYLNDNYINKKPVGTYYNLKKNTDFINNFLKNYDIFYTFHDPGLIIDKNKKILKLIP